MLFTGILNKKTQELQPEFDKLFKDILENQTHDGDLLLMRVNGFYYPEANNWDNTLFKNPYMIGPNTEGHSDYWHYRFINNYRQNSTSSLTFDEYLEKNKWSQCNYIKNDAASQIQVLSFDEWIDMFHDTMVIYNQMIRFNHLIDDLYSKAAGVNNLLFEVRLNRIDPVEKTEYYLLKYRPEFNDWDFNENKTTAKKV